uniref:Putative secreted peptide n=1 Tax=Anopheles braziliensis TaxID=58242 RepID=A0A2M3ZTV9_9DIPT
MWSLISTSSCCVLWYGGTISQKTSSPTTSIIGSVIKHSKPTTSRHSANPGEHRCVGTQSSDAIKSTNMTHWPATRCHRRGPFRANRTVINRQRTGRWIGMPHQHRQL